MSDFEGANQKEQDRVEAQVRALKAQARIREIHQRELGWAASTVMGQISSASAGRVNGQHYVAGDAMVAQIAHLLALQVCSAKMLVMLVETQPAAAAHAVSAFMSSWRDINLSLGTKADDAPSIIRLER